MTPGLLRVGQSPAPEKKKNEAEGRHSVLTRNGLGLSRLEQEAGAFGSTTVPECKILGRSARHQPSVLVHRFPSPGWLRTLQNTSPASRRYLVG